MMESKTVNMKVDSVLVAVLEKLGGKYQHVKHLGGGEFSNVYLVKHTTSGINYALKIMDYHYLIQRLRKEDLANSKNKFNEIRKRFDIEAKMYGKIDHRHIVKILDTGFVPNESNDIEIPFIIMNYIHGQSLAEVLKKEAPFDINRSLAIAKSLLSVIDAIHRNNIIHRDIKPANIMIEKETGEAILIDFGIAKDIVDGTRLTTTGAFLGSPVYMAPEQFSDSSKVGPEIDTYAFGVVLYEMLTGEPPYKGNNLAEIMSAHREKPVPNVRDVNPALPVGMEDILFKAMAKNPDYRYKDAKEFLKDLQNVGEKKRRISRRLKYKLDYFYLLYLLIALVIIALIFLKPFGRQLEAPTVKPDSQQGKERMIEKISAGKTDVVNVNKDEIQASEIAAAFDNLKRLLESGSHSDNEKIKACRGFLDKYGSVKNAKEKVIEIEKCLKTLNANDEYARFIGTVKKYMGKEDFPAAADALKKAQAIKDNEEIKGLSNLILEKTNEFEKKNGGIDYNAVKEKINIKKYLAFKARYPGSKYLIDLQDRLKNKDVNLPPEKYWLTALQKNQRGYYEATFGPDHNGHRMIYIPGKNIWIDKYEVSNLQFKRFLNDLNIGVVRETDSKYIKGGDEYPAVSSYEEAEKYCRHYGLRLPTVQEWQYAAGKGVNNYPWGDELPDDGGFYRANFESLEGATEKDGFSGTAPVTSFEKFNSPFGVINMAGNVWEWVQGRILKGGGFFSSKEDLLIEKSVGGRENDREGFRCVKDDIKE